MEQHGVSCNSASEWLSEFRAFHSKEPFLSGVGRNSQAVGIVEGRAPLDPHKHCDDEDYQEPRDSVTFGLRSYLFPGLESSDIGYPIHESCWQLLHRQAQLHGVENLKASCYTNFLYRLHHSALDDPGRDWAGDYGGLLDAAGELIIPATRAATFNPLDIKPISTLIKRAKCGDVASMKEEPIFGKTRMLQVSTSPTVVTHSEPGPSLHTLPAELILMVIEQISLRDFLSLWIASPAAPDYLTQTFWRSRFKRGMEFGHLFEFQELWDSPYVHWYTLFWKSEEISASHTGSAISNRRRILAVADRMVELSSKYVDQSVEGTEKASVNPILLETNGVLGCQKQVALPPPSKINELHISTIQLGSRRYISGVRINGSTKGLGVYHESSCEVFRIDTASHGSVREFLCYMDCMGVRGLYFVTDRGRKVGQIYESAIGDHLSRGVLPMGKRLIANIDATRFTALGVDDPLTRTQDSRNHLLWREGPPEDAAVDLERHLYHKIHAQYRTPWHIKYNPVQYHLFDTRDSLVGITGYVGSFNANLIGLEFAYKPGNAPDLAPARAFFGARQGTPMRFPIDGPGGEYLTGLSITITTTSMVAPIISLFTNRNRSIQFFLKSIEILQGFIQESRYYSPGEDEYVAGLMWAPGGDERGRIWNFGILCRSQSAFRS